MAPANTKARICGPFSLVRSRATSDAKVGRTRSDIVQVGTGLQSGVSHVDLVETRCVRSISGGFVVLALALSSASSSALAATTIGPDLSIGSAGSVISCSSPGWTTTAGESGTATPSGCMSMLIGSGTIVPADGVLVSFSVRLSSATSGWLRLLYPRNTVSGNYMAGYGRSDTVAVPGDSVVHTYPARLPVVAGMSIGFTTPLPAASLIVRSGVPTGARIFVDQVQDNHGLSEANTGNDLNSFQVPLSAKIEPDADRDGFGDETQDGCVGVAGADNGCVPQPPPPPPPAGGGQAGGGSTPPGGGNATPAQPGLTSPSTAVMPDRVAPRLSSFLLAPESFVAANSGATVAAAKRVGTTVIYDLSEKATATFAVARKAPGVRKGKSCVAGKPGPGKKACTRSVTLGSFRQNGDAGLNRFRFMGRLKGKALARGTYALAATATDAAGNTSKTVTRAFRIVG